MCYLVDLTDECGPLRVLPGSHLLKNPDDLDDKLQPHPAERMLRLKAGDAVLFHDGMVHSGTTNVSASTRLFVGLTFNQTWMKQEDDFSGPECERLRAEATAKSDRRTQRLLGIDSRLHRRLNSGLTPWDDEHWAQWIREDDDFFSGSSAAKPNG